jgi:hypothetical protein
VVILAAIDIKTAIVVTSNWGRMPGNRAPISEHLT